MDERSPCGPTISPVFTIRLMLPPLPGLEFGLLNALVPFAFTIGIRGPTLVREPVVRVKSGGVTPFWSVLGRYIGKDAGAFTIRMLPAVMVFAKTVETEVPVMFAIFISPPTKTVPTTKPGALRFPPTVIVVGGPPEKIPPPANKSKPALTLPGCTTPPDLNSIGPEPDEILPPAVIDPPAVIIRCAEIFPPAEMLPSAVRTAVWISPVAKIEPWASIKPENTG